MGLLRDTDQFIQWDSRRQMYMPVYWRKEVLPFWLGFDEGDLQAPNGVLTINAAGVDTPPVNFKQRYDSVEGLDDGLGTPFEVRSLVFEDSTDGTAAANFTISMQEVGERRLLMNNPCHIRTIAGSAQLPGLLREPLYLLSQHAVNCKFNKISGGAISMRMFMVGAQFYPWSPEFMRFREDRKQLTDRVRKWIKRRETVGPFWLTTDEAVNIGANATAEFLMKPGNDAQFEAMTVMSVSTGNFSWSLSEVKTNQTLMNGDATQTNALGDIFFPTMLPTSYVVPSDRRLRLRVTDLSGAPNQIFFTVGGRKIYAPMSKMQQALADTAVPTPADTQQVFSPKPLV